MKTLGRFVFMGGALLVLLGIPCAKSYGAETSFAEANSLYGQGDFKSAIVLYEKIAESGKSTGALYFNLGNAYFRVGQKGKAVVAYERALRLMPRDEDLRWNIAILKSALADRIESKSANPLTYFIGRVTELISIEELAALFGLALLLFFVLSLCSFLWQGFRTWSAAARFLVLCLAGAVLFFLVWKWQEVKNPEIVVLDKEVTARFGPSLKETTAFLLHEGAQAKVLDEVHDWYYLLLPNRSLGWVPKKSCEVV